MALSVNLPEQAPPAVLLVDDDPRNLLALETVLSDGDFVLHKAESGEDALLALMKNEFAAIVLDVNMPDLSGIELARMIKQRKSTQHIPIIFLTAHYREEAHVVLGYDVGAVDYLTKPLNPAVLRSKVNVFVDLFRKSRDLAALNLKLEEQNTALQREAEERMRRVRAEAAQAEAEAANAAKDRFLAMLSHELRTPLSPILYSVAILERESEAPAVLEVAEIIKRNIAIETRLIDDLLDLARIRSGKLEIRLEPVDLHKVIADAIDTCHAEISRRGISLSQDLGAERSHLNGDAARLQQVIWNLLMNAAKFSAEGGDVRICTSNPPGYPESVLIEVIDNGVGIEAGQLGRIFDAFEQASAARKAGGLGLGLAICKGLVELHDGRIWAESNGSGTGTRFHVQIPISRAAPVVAETSSQPAIQRSDSRVLLVEDHHDTAQMLRLLLERSGFEVRTASSVGQALEMAEQYIFDILVSDLGLPDGHGTELLVELRQRVQRAFPAIAMSGFGMNEDLRRSASAGFGAHLVKPVDFRQLETALNDIFHPSDEHLPN